MVMPGKISPGTVVSQPVESLDVVPTILSLIGEKADTSLAGKDLTPFFKGDPVELKGTFARWEGNSSYREDRWKLIRSEKGRFELYDLRPDPAEEDNVATDNPRVLRHMDFAREDLASREIDIDMKTGQPLEDKLRSLGYLQ